MSVGKRLLLEVFIKCVHSYRHSHNAVRCLLSGHSLSSQTLRWQEHCQCGGR